MTVEEKEREEKRPVRVEGVVALRDLPQGGERFEVESGKGAVLFCREGSDRISLRMRETMEIPLQTGDILILRETLLLQPGRDASTLNSVLVSAGELPVWDRDRRQVVRLQESLWSRALFETLDALKPEDLQPYFELKLPEMFYLVERGTLALWEDQIALVEDRHRFQMAQQVDAWIRGHLDSDLSIDALCRVVHSSATTLKRNYREVFGLSIHRAVVRHRMEEASRMLLSTNETVQKIALHVGYGSTSQFGTVFQRFYGMTPARFRQAKKV